MKFPIPRMNEWMACRDCDDSFSKRILIFVSSRRNFPPPFANKQRGSESERGQCWSTHFWESSWNTRHLPKGFARVRDKVDKISGAGLGWRPRVNSILYVLVEGIKRFKTKSVVCGGNGGVPCYKCD